MKSVYHFIVLVLFVAFAGQVTNAYAGPAEKRLYKSFLDASCEHVHNGDCFVARYDVRKFKFSKAVEEALTQEEGEAKLVPTLKWKHIISEFEQYTNKDKRAFDALREMLKRKLVRAMIAVSPDPETCTESEYCTYMHLYIYTRDGYKLYLDFDYTT